MKRREIDLQIRCANYLDSEGIAFYSIPNVAPNIGQGNLMNLLGRKKGVPDLMVTKKSSPYSSLAVELKVNGNLPSSAQLSWLKKLIGEGYFGCWLNNFDAFMHLINTYISRPKDLTSFWCKSSYKYL